MEKLKKTKKNTYKTLFVILVITLLTLGVVSLKSMATFALESKIVVDQNNFMEYFTQNGSTKGKYDPTTGIQSITDASNQSGNITFNGTINLNNNFEISGSVNVGEATKSGAYYGVADGIGFVFYKGAKNQVGGSGASLGINGISNASGWKLDTYHNGGASLSNGDSDIGLSNPYGAFVTTDDKGYGSIDKTTYQPITPAIIDNQFYPITFKYEALSKTLTVILTTPDGDLTYSKVITYDETDPAYYFTITASTGALPTHHSFQMNKMEYYSIEKAIFNYVDDETGKTIFSESVTGESATPIQYNIEDKIKEYLAKGYELVNNTFTAGTKYDNDDKVDQMFTVHLKHGQTKTTETKKVSHIVHYSYEDGSTAAADSISADIVFSQVTTTDKVTGKVVKIDPWTTLGDIKSFSEVVSPLIIGHTADKLTIPEIVDVSPEVGTMVDTVVYTPNQYTVAFNHNHEGPGEMNNQIFTYGQAQRLSANSYTRAGYTFEGWNTTKDCSGTAYMNKSEVKNLSAKNGETITLYAQWKAVEQSINFDAAGGQTSQRSIVGITDEEIDLSKVTPATQKGYTFTGWYNGETAILASIKMPAGGITYTAQWKANQYTVDFNRNNEGSDSGVMNPQNFTYGVSQNLTTNGYTRAGYTFAGWNTAADGSGKIYADKAIVENLTAIDGGKITLYAQWVANSQGINFDANGGKTSQTSLIGETDQTIDLSQIASATKEGYRFLGWYNGTESMPTTISMPVGGLTYTAQWEANEYLVKFNNNNGEGAMSEQLFTYDVAKKLKGNQYTRPGYSFGGWNTAADGTGKQFADAGEVKNLTATNDETIILYAQWIAGDQGITFDPTGGTTNQMAIAGKTDEIVDLGQVTFATKEGYRFLGWYNGEELMPNTVNMPVGGLMYSAKWSANHYTVSFDSNHGEGEMNSQNFIYDTTENLTRNAYSRAGYIFTGWNTAADGSGISYTDNSEVMNLTEKEGANVVLYAQWKSTEQTVSFDPNGGETTQLSLKGLTDSLLDLSNIASATLTGYTFNGWYNSNSAMPTSLMIPAGGLTYTAKWQANQYTVSFNGYEGLGAMDDQVMIYDQLQALYPNRFMRDGYNFVGWNTRADGSGANYGNEMEVQNLIAESGGHVVLYAQWAANPKLSDTKVDPDPTNTTSQNTNISDPVGKVASKAAKQQRALPQTDEANASYITLLGIGLIGVTGTLRLKKQKK